MKTLPDGMSYYMKILEKFIVLSEPSKTFRIANNEREENNKHEAGKKSFAEKTQNVSRELQLSATECNAQNVRRRKVSLLQFLAPSFLGKI